MYGHTNTRDQRGNSNLYNLKEYKDLNPNKLDKFTYNANGNLTSDFDRNIVTGRYNYLNLPDTIQFKNGHQIINKYDARIANPRERWENDNLTI